MHGPSPRVALHAAALALLALLALAAPALAAPVLRDNTFEGRPGATGDVLANDQGTGLHVTGITVEPEHGTARCSEMGACEYHPTDDYAGTTDQFTYEVTDSVGDKATAVVHLNLLGSSAGQPLIPSDDQVATKAGTPVTVDVLRNDLGKAPLTVTAVTVDPSHGTVDCSAGTSCTYTPAPGFDRGTDGFRYKVSDGNAPAHTATADAHVLVIPADSRFTMSAGGPAGTVPVGGGGDWGLSVLGIGFSSEELGALATPDLTFDLQGPHKVIGAVKRASGWGRGVVAPPDASVETSVADAPRGGLLGDSVSEAFPKPLPPLSQGTGGDGHVPILVGTKVLAYFHHDGHTRVSCADRRTGTLCPGYPIYVQGATNNQNGPGAVIGTKSWTHIFPRDYTDGSQYTSPVGLFCWDVATNDTCGYTFLDRVAGGDPSASAPVTVDGKVYLAAETGKLYCYDPAADEACGTLPTGLSGSTYAFDIVTHGSRVYVSKSGSSGKVACLDVKAKSVCPGWDTPADFNADPTRNTGYNLITLHDTAGAATGICVVGGANLDCIADDDPARAIFRKTTGFVPTDDGYSVTTEAEAGTRTLIPNNNASGLYCWDWSTNAACTGPNFGAGGYVSRDKDGHGLFRAYGAVWDGSCAVAVGDSQTIYTVDAEGNSPCASLSSGTTRRVIDLRDQRCDGTVGSATWKDLVLTDVGAGELTTAKVTVRDAVTDEVLATADLAGGDHRLDLSGIDAQAHPSVTIDATSTSPTGDPAWDDAIPPRLRLSWNADPKQVCFSTRSTADCSAPADTKLGVTGHLASAGEDRKAEAPLAHDPACDPKPQPQPEPPAPPAAQEPVPDPPKPVVAVSKPPRKCGGARLFTIHVRFSSKKVRKITVTVNGKRQKMVSNKSRPIFRIDLRKLPKQRTVVKIVLKTKSGKTLRGTRVYNPCTKKLPDRGFKL